MTLDELDEAGDGGHVVPTCGSFSTTGQGPASCSLPAVAAGYAHTCALTASGSVRCWGLGESGRLGYGNTESIGDDETPASAGAVDVGENVAQVATGFAHTCAVLENGNVRCWGGDAYGVLGYGNSNSNEIGDDETPASVRDVEVGGSVARIAAGTFHTCVLLTNGNVRCWGWGRYGQLGYGNDDNIGDDETPASAGDVDVGGSVAQIAAGSDHTCALLTNGNVRCWGGGTDGALGHADRNDIGDDEAPASAGDVEVGGSVAQIAVGDAHTCALLRNGKVRCWGWSAQGQLGYGNRDDVGNGKTPASAGDVDVGGSVTQLATGYASTCALLANGNVRCWGAGAFGLGYGDTESIGDDEAPASAGDIDVGGPVTRIAVGGHACALFASGSVRCWGVGGSGQLGYGNTENIGDDETPASAGDVPYL